MYWPAWLCISCISPGWLYILWFAWMAVAFSFGLINSLYSQSTWSRYTAWAMRKLGTVGTHCDACGRVCWNLEAHSKTYDAADPAGIIVLWGGIKWVAFMMTVMTLNLSDERLGGRSSSHNQMGITLSSGHEQCMSSPPGTIIDENFMCSMRLRS